MTFPLKTRVFVGSSTEGLGKAHEICDLLRSDRTEALIWSDVFEPGYVTIETLERILDECGGAVLVATPDDKTTIREKLVLTPRANVMLEFGLLAGRLGRHNIAICRYGGAELPSDLKGLTVIEMDPPAGPIDPAVARRPSAEAYLKAWSARVLPTAEKVERTSIVHGYTGEWALEISLEQWRGVALDSLAPGSYVQGYGEAHLYVDDTGQTGSGILKGLLTFNLRRAGTDALAAFTGELRFCHEATELLCDAGGGITVTTRTFSLQEQRASGPPLPELGPLAANPEPWPFSWKLAPTESPRTLTGTLTAENPGATRGTIRLRKPARGT